MKKLFVLVLVYSAVQTTLLSQEKEFDVGKIKPEELAINVCPIDSNAGAWIIGEYGTVDYRYSQTEGFLLYYNHKVRIKILKNTEFDQASFAIPIYQFSYNWEKIDIDGYTYNLEAGKVVKSKLTKDSRFEESVNKNKKNIKITLPNVREGSVIDLEYTITSPYVWEVRDWFFQQDIPVLYSKFVANFPQYYTFKKFLNGFINVDIKQEQINTSFTYTEKERSDGLATSTQYYTGQVDYTLYRTTYIARNVEPFKEEPYLSSARNYISLLEYELESVQYPHDIPHYYSKNWETINKELMEDEDFGLLLNRSGFVKDTVQKLTGNLTDPMAKAQAVYVYLRDNLKWNGSKRYYASNSLKKAFDTKTGNSAEINLLLTVMLREAGIKADPVILSTRDNGIALISYPIINKFNYVISAAKIDGKTYLMDATNPYIPFGMLPERCLNGQGRIISQTASETVDLVPSTNYFKTAIAQMKLNPENGDLTGSMKIYCKGYAAANDRTNIAESKSKDDYIKQMQDKSPGLSIESYNFYGLDSLDIPLQKILGQVTINSATTAAGDIITLNPMLFEQTTKNPFKLDQRKYPVDYTYPYDQTFVFILDIPEGYVVDELPVSGAISMPDNAARYMYSVNSTNGKIQLTSKFSIKKTLYNEDEYPQLKEFYNQIVAKNAQLVVLKKGTDKTANQ
jgi:transglutaminase-like putative cysteine protease